MIFPDHGSIARNLLGLSERLFGENEKVLGAEALWGAAIHSVNAAATRHGLAHGQYRHKMGAVRRLSQDYGNGDTFTSGFNVARTRLHVYFDKVHLNDEQLTTDREIVREFVTRMLTLAEAPQAD